MLRMRCLLRGVLLAIGLNVLLAALTLSPSMSAQDARAPSRFDAALEDSRFLSAHQVAVEPASRVRDVSVATTDDITALRHPASLIEMSPHDH